jgi:hypothetical protein
MGPHELSLVDKNITFYIAEAGVTPLMPVKTEILATRLLDKKIIRKRIQC